MASNLENLARARQLNAEPPDRAEIANLLADARAQLGDARNAGLNASSRFALAYNAAHALALAALRANGYRPSSAGHRRILFQALDATCNAPRDLRMALDRYHDRRNRMTYEGAAAAGDVEARDLTKLAGELEPLVAKTVKAKGF